MGSPYPIVSHPDLSTYQIYDGGRLEVIPRYTTCQPFQHQHVSFPRFRDARESSRLPIMTKPIRLATSAFCWDFRNGSLTPGTSRDAIELPITVKALRNRENALGSECAKASVDRLAYLRAIEDAMGEIQAERACESRSTASRSNSDVSLLDEDLSCDPRVHLQAYPPLTPNHVRQPRYTVDIDLIDFLDGHGWESSKTEGIANEAKEVGVNLLRSLLCSDESS